MKHSAFKSWLQALRLPSNVNLIFPLLLGQALAYAATSSFSWAVFGWIMLYGWLDQMYIVFWNDYADREADLQNKKFNMFSGGSRVLPEKKLQPRSLFLAGLANLLGVMVVGLVLTVQFERVWTVPLFLIGLLLLWMYSLPPFKLNYRGGGEILQGLGCGVLLPIIGFYVQSGTFLGFTWLILIPFFLFHYTSSVATTLPDFDADRKAPKQTLAVLMGKKFAGLIVCILASIGIVISVFVLDARAIPILIFSLLMPLVLIGICFSLVRRLEKSQKAILAFDACIILLGIVFVAGICTDLVFMR